MQSIPAKSLTNEKIFIDRGRNSPDRRIVAVIPAYNEERFIGSIVLKSQRFASQVIVVDDGSSDATAELAATAGAVVVRHTQNQGKGAALTTGFQKACELGPDAVVTFDADGQHDAAELTTVIDPILRGEADIVIGSRYLEETSYVPTHRVWGHRAFNFLTNHASGTAVSDSQSGFRAFSPSVLSKLTFSSSSFSVESEMQFIAHEHELVVKEVPITISYPDKPKRPVIQHGLIVLNGILQLTGQYRPLLFFGLSGLIMFLIGTGWGLWVVDIFRRTHELAMGYALISAILFIAGLTLFSTGIILHSIRGLLTMYLDKRAFPQ